MTSSSSTNFDEYSMYIPPPIHTLFVFSRSARLDDIGAASRCLSGIGLVGCGLGFPVLGRLFVLLAGLGYNFGASATTRCGLLLICRAVALHELCLLILESGIGLQLPSCLGFHLPVLQLIHYTIECNDVGGGGECF